MTRKVILDVDPGIADAAALAIALFDPNLDVVAVTATGGNVSAEQAGKNVQAIVEQLDPPRLPRIGWGTPPATGPTVDRRHLFGPFGLGETDFQVAELHQRHPAEKVICDEVRAAPDMVSIVALGPLTNVARAMMRDPELPSLIGEIVIAGGAVSCPGNVTPAAEFNVYCDPESARIVFRSPTTKTLVPLDVTNQLVMNYDLLDRLPSQSTRAGQFLHRILPFMFRSHHQHLGEEGIRLHEAVGLVCASNPELFHREPMAGDVETSGELTVGATIFDRRRRPEWRPNMEVATTVDTVAVADCILRGLARLGAV
jgi:purine nucleosidase